MAKQTLDTKVAVLENQLTNLTQKVDIIGTKMDSLHEKIDDHYIKKEDFIPVKKDVEKLKYWQIKVVAYATMAAFTLQYLPGVLREIFKAFIK